MAFCRVPVFLPVFIRHDQRPVVRHVFAHFFFMVLEIFEKHVDCIFPSVCEWAKSLSLAPHNHIRKAAWFMLLCFYCEAIFAVWLACVYLFLVCIQSRHKRHKALSFACKSFERPSCSRHLSASPFLWGFSAALCIRACAFRAVLSSNSRVGSVRRNACFHCAWFGHIKALRAFSQGSSGCFRLALPTSS